MKRFLTLFPDTENVHLIKDVGMIPYVLYKEYGYDSTIASFENGKYPYMSKEVLGLKQIFIKKIFKKNKFNIYWFILSNFRKFDILQCYHIANKSLYYLLFFKFLKTITFSSGITYLKFDLDDSVLQKDLRKKFIFLMMRINILSVESKTLHFHLNNKKILDNRVNYIPNGFYDIQKRKIIDFSFKENLIITVGRIGSEQKNNEVLLEAFKSFAKTNLDWKLELIGPIEKHFQSYIDDYFNENPNLNSRVTFTGNISDRTLLQEKYNLAKIFVLTSRREGFPLVFLEAMKSGCNIISTNLACALDVTDNRKYGNLFEIEDHQALAKILLETVKNQKKLEDNCVEIQKFASQNFSWKKICGNVDHLIINSCKISQN